MKTIIKISEFLADIYGFFMTVDVLISFDFTCNKTKSSGTGHDTYKICRPVSGAKMKEIVPLIVEDLQKNNGIEEPNVVIVGMFRLQRLGFLWL